MLASGRLPLVSHASPRHRAQRVHQHCALPLPSVPCAQMYPPFQIGCAAGVCLTCLWSVRGWTLMCCSETRGFCHCGASGSEGHSEVLVYVQNRRQQGQSGRHDTIEDSCAPATRGQDGNLQSSCYCWRGGWQIVLHHSRWQCGCSGSFRRSAMRRWQNCNSIFVLRYWPPVLRDVVFIQVQG